MSRLKAEITQQRIKTNLTYLNMVMVNVDIQYPKVKVPGRPGVSQSITAHYHNVAHRYYLYISTQIYHTAIQDYKMSLQQQRPFFPYDAMMVYQAPYNKNGFLSIYYETYQYTGGAHGMTYRYADTWNLETGAQMSLSDLFKPGSNYKAVIIGEIYKQIEQQMASGSNYYFDGYKENVLKYFNPKNYYLTGKGIAVYFGLYEIAPYSSGIPVFVIPYSKFGGMLKYKL